MIISRLQKHNLLQAEPERVCQMNSKRICTTHLCIAPGMKNVFDRTTCRLQISVKIIGIKSQSRFSQQHKHLFDVQTDFFYSEQPEELKYTKNFRRARLRYFNLFIKIQYARSLDVC